MKTIAVLGLLLAAVPAALAAEDPLLAAKDLYASASYEEALTTLSGIESPPAEIARQVDMYRAFSLYALGRTAEAEKVAESLIRREPMMELDEAAPRIEAMFQNVRKRLLPVLIRAEYRTARTELDGKKPESAKVHLNDARRMLASAQKIGAWDEGLADLQVLVDGFLDLTRAAADQSSLAVPAAVVSPAAAQMAQPIVPPVPVQRAAAQSSYGPEDEGVTPPSVVDQRSPLMPEQLCWSVMQATGQFEPLRAQATAEVDAKTKLTDAEKADPTKQAERATAIEKLFREKLRGHEDQYVRSFGGAAGQPQTDFFATPEQALYFENGGVLRSWAAGLANRVAALPEPKVMAEELYLSTLTRLPGEAESVELANALATHPADQKAAVLTDLTWALITSIEFRFSH